MLDHEYQKSNSRTSRRVADADHIGLFEMANDYIKFGRTEYEVVGGTLDVQHSIPNVLLIFVQVISHRSAMRTKR